MNPVMATFFDALNDGVVIVNPQGQVQYANAAGSRLLGATVGQNFPDPTVLKGLLDMVAGYLKPPVRIPTGGSPGSARNQMATVTPLPLPNTFAITVQNVQEQTFFQTTLNNLFDFLNIDLAQPIERFSAGVDRLAREHEAFADDETCRTLRESGASISLSLQRMKALATLFKTTALVDRERLPIASMVKEALDLSAERIADRRLSVHVDGLDKELPPIYGSRIWLTRAMAELIDNAARYSGDTTTIEIGLRCTGTHVLLHFRNHGKFMPRHLGGHPVYVPFHRVSDYVRQKKMPARPLVGQAPDASLGCGPGLGLPMCERIVALHGGRIQMPEIGGDELVEFVLEIPTGAPSQGDEALDIQQAQRYARDMATIMQRMRQRRERPA